MRSKNLTDFMNGNAFLLNYAQFPYFVISPEQFVVLMLHLVSEIMF